MSTFNVWCRRCARDCDFGEMLTSQTQPGEHVFYDFAEKQMLNEVPPMPSKKKKQEALFSKQSLKAKKQREKEERKDCRES